MSRFRILTIAAIAVGLTSQAHGQEQLPDWTRQGGTSAYHGWGGPGATTVFSNYCQDHWRNNCCSDVWRGYCSERECWPSPECGACAPGCNTYNCRPACNGCNGNGYGYSGGMPVQTYEWTTPQSLPSQSQTVDPAPNPDGSVAWYRAPWSRRRQ